MCIYCERKTDKNGFGWENPKLPYHGTKPMEQLGGNALETEKWEGQIFDYKTAPPQLKLLCRGFFNGEGIGTICIPIKYCPECGRKLGSNNRRTYTPAEKKEFLKNQIKEETNEES